MEFLLGDMKNIIKLDYGHGCTNVWLPQNCWIIYFGWSGIKLLEADFQINKSKLYTIKSNTTTEVVKQNVITKKLIDRQYGTIKKLLNKSKRR